MKKLKQNIYTLIDEDKGNNKADAYVDIFVSILIIFNVFFIFLESYPTIKGEFGDFFHGFELFSIVIFSVEYILRVWTADLLYPNLKPFRARLKFIFSPLGLIDLFAILPFFLPLIFKLDLRIMRALRLLRLLRMFKLGRHSSSLKLIGSVIKETKYDLLVTVFLTFILLIIASTLMFYIENDAQPDAFENIGEAMWWAVATLTTVGYGDIYPVTGFGKLLSGLIALIGIGIVALPTGIISSAFVEKLNERKEAKKAKAESEAQTNKPDWKFCPHCGKELSEH